ncbi:hypothetical protein AB0C33_02035 [Nonomuraea sp. NPDC048881]|uniref:hypothetical protein n=1 Tax=Nonomuraea sp. NPDC048881 TaxID=3155030 RepID=UPI0033C2A81A
MATRTITICDVHGEACKAKPEDIQPRKFYDIITGDAYEVDLCPPEWSKYEKASDTFKAQARLAPVPVATSNGSEEKAQWKPLIDAMKAWHKVAFGEVPKGNFGHKSDKVAQFLKTPGGEKWATWEPGQPLPQ